MLYGTINKTLQKQKKAVWLWFILKPLIYLYHYVFMPVTSNSLLLWLKWVDLWGKWVNGGMWNIFHHSYKLEILKENNFFLMYLPSVSNLAVAEFSKQYRTQYAYCMWWFFFLNCSQGSGCVTKMQNVLAGSALLKGQWISLWQKNRQLRLEEVP